MKKYLFLAVLSVVILGLSVDSIIAASSRLVWSDYDYEVGEVTFELSIEDGEEYQVPFGVTKEIFAESDLAESIAVGSLYFIDPDTLEREFVADVGGFSGVDEWAWDRAGDYEFDFYNFNLAPVKAPWYRNWLASIFRTVAHAFDEEEFLETIHFNIQAEALSDGPNPVIIVPGIMGSYLNREDGTEVWMNLARMVLPGDDSYLDELILEADGASIITLMPTDLIRETGIPLFKRNIFKGLVDNLESNGYIENQNLFVFPYDWRLNIRDNVTKLKATIDLIRSQSSSEKVDVLAHSMGGLLVKSFFDQYGSEHVEKFIDISTPHQGSPESFITLNHGDVGIAILNSQKVREISQNMPSVYQLLPTMAYGPYLYDMDDLDGNGVAGQLDYRETQEFMKNMGRNSLLVDRAEEFHQEVDDLDPADYGVETYNFVGCGTPTLDKIFVLDQELSGGVEYNISFTNGDGTVPLKSAQALPATETYYLKNANHGLMPSTVGIRDAIVSILKGGDVDLPSYPNLSSTSDDCPMPDGRIVSFHSPIDLHIYDPSGNHTGPNVNGDLEQNIPGVAYEVIDGNKFAFLPEGTNYVVKGKSTGQGTFNVRIEQVEGEAVVGSQYFSSVSLTSTTLVEVGESSVTLDDNGDGKVDGLVFPDGIEVSALIKVLKDQIQALNVKDKIKTNLLKRVENIEKKIEKKISKNQSLEGIKKRILNIINGIVKKTNKGKIDDNEAQVIIGLLEQLESGL